MKYFLTEVELTTPLGDISVPADASGVAVLIRNATRPIGFIMHELPGPALVSSARLRELVIAECRGNIIAEGVRRELSAGPGNAADVSVSVAVCTRDRPELLRRCLRSLHELEGSGSGSSPSEIIVVDNASAGNVTVDVVREFPGVRYCREPRAGLDFARNHALREARGEFLAYLDDDAVADRHWLAGLRRALAEHPRAGAVTGAVLPLALDTEAQIMFEKRGGFQRGFQRIRHGPSRPRDHLYPCGAGIFGAGANMAFRRQLLLELGGFDEALDTGPPLPGGGDLDIFYRVIRAGHPLVYEPAFMVFHEHRRDLAGLRRQYWSWGLGFMAFLDKSLSSDAANREALLQTRRWWFGDQLGRLARSLTGRSDVPARMIAAELWGSVCGVAGEYSRSVRRSARIRTAAHG